MGVDFTLKIEPCLFEWTGWFADFMPKWLTVPEFAENGYKVDSSYAPFMDVSEIVGSEEKDEYYRRTHRLILHLLSQTGTVQYHLRLRSFPYIGIIFTMYP